MPHLTTCRACGKVCLRSSGYRRHLLQCKSHLAQSNAALFDTSQTRATLLESADPIHEDPENHIEGGLMIYPPAAQAGEPALYHNNIPQSEDVSVAGLSDGSQDALELFEDLDTENQSVSSSAAGAASTPASPMAMLDDLDDGVSIATAGTISLNKGRLASTNGTSPPDIRWYNEETGKSAGVGLFENEISADSATASYEFSSEFELGFARWIHLENISSNALDRLLADSRLELLRSLTGWKSAKDIKRKLCTTGSRESRLLGNWAKKTTELENPRALDGKVVHTLRYRSVEDAVRFFLGHTGFKHDLIFAPRQVWTSDQPPLRVYSDMSSADWWWDTQGKLPFNDATVVPLIIASDKTQVTNHQGDLAAYPVYLTVGNLPAHIRNSNERPGTILLAMLPIVKDGDGEYRTQIFQECMRILFDPVMESVRSGGIMVPCADGWTRRCFPIIAAMAIDHEEQVRVTGVNNKTHCSMCMVPPSEREDLETWAPWRTHQATMAQHLKQLHREGKPDQMWVHAVDCFAWGHLYVNIHQSMMVDILHQLLKGVLMHTFQWTLALLEDRMVNKPTKRLKALAAESERLSGGPLHKRAASKRMVHQLIDRRFASIPPYSDMRVFRHLSSVQQWTGKEQKSILRQMLPVFTPLLEEVGAIEAIRFIRAVVDFILLAMYKSHDDDTLRFMTLALYRINQYKEIFRPYRPSYGRKDAANLELEGHFNFPKFYAMVHYIDIIKLFGNAPDLETGHFEHKHVEFVKNPFKITNRKPG